MALEQFIALWTHRYHKYSHIARAHRKAWQAWSYFFWKKQSFPAGKQLIAIIRTEHFGDIIATEPLSRHIREEFPNAHLVWFVKPVFKELIETNPHVDEAFPEFCVTQRQTLLKTGVFDQIFELQFRNNNHCATCDVYVENPLAEAKGVNVHTYFNFGNLLSVFAQIAGLSQPRDDQPRLYLQQRHQLKVDALRLPDSFIVIHCQSNYTPKDWPKEQWNHLIYYLLEQYSFSIVEVGLSSNLSVRHPNFHSLTGKLSILETAEVIRRADYFIGLDSGPSHLANAAGTFGFVLMGSLNDFPAYNPFSGSYGRQENCVLIRQEGIPCAQLPFETVVEAIHAHMPAQVKS
ncbi:glycosyltransferase family 9 protein [Arundinibacter roseus]|uniref:ADP-heptose--LPS heptosyltransferase n=1 Tax=Arundinibacter roseus TaxID=2070510 RepID=A0A4R4KBP2_9BACT|nr:glycosyltransferase family 9 protein [Arundinibacter roseus]TDB65314.1 ADP-heptose--LPS heptosyltransferase [Arundinibacter roseus]